MSVPRIVTYVSGFPASSELELRIARRLRRSLPVHHRDRLSSMFAHVQLDETGLVSAHVRLRLTSGRPLDGFADGLIGPERAVAQALSIAVRRLDVLYPPAPARRWWSRGLPRLRV